MNINLQQVLNDLVDQPGLGMFAWLCFVFFIIAFIFFVWALSSGQLTNLEESKFDMFDDDQKKEVDSVKRL